MSMFASLASSTSATEITAKKPRKPRTPKDPIEQEPIKPVEPDQLFTDVRRILIILNDTYDERGMTMSELARRNRHGVYTKQRRYDALDRACAIGYISVRVLPQYAWSEKFSTFYKLTAKGRRYAEKLLMGKV